MRRLISAVVVTTCFMSSAWAVPLQSFPADVQQILKIVRAQLPPDARMLGDNAIRLLTPDQARLAVNNIRSMVAQFGLPAVISLALTIDQIRQALPPQSQQAFINGIWGVSAREEQYAKTVLQAACIQSGAPRERCGLGGTGPVAPQGPSSPMRPVAGSGTLSSGADARGPYAPGMAGLYDTRGGMLVFRDPQDPTYQATYPITSASSNMSWWRCYESHDVEPSMASPGISCRQVYPR